MRAELGRHQPTAVTAPSLPSFPIDALPGWLAAMVYATTESMQVPGDLPAMTALGALSATAAGRAEVIVRPGWRETLSLFVVVAAESSERKSPVHRLITAPLRAAEKSLREQLGESRAAAELDRDFHLARAAKARAIAVDSGDTTAMAEALDAEMVATAIVVPPEPRLVAGGDATPEAIVQLLVKHGRIAILDTEGGLFDLLGGRHSNGLKNLDAVLQAYSGDPIAVERRGRDAEFVARPALALVLAVQPLTLAKVVRDPDMNGRGMTARFLISVPAPRVGRRLTGHAVPAIPGPVQEEFSRALEELAIGLNAWTDPAMIGFSIDALDALYGFEATVEQRLGRGGDLRPTGAWGGKLVGQVVRLSGLLHLATAGPILGPRSVIQAATVRSALSIGEYLTAHAIAAFVAPTGNGESSAAAEVLAKLRKVGKAQITTRELHRALRSAPFAKVESVRAALGALEELGWVERSDQAGQTWVTHPEITENGEQA